MRETAVSESVTLWDTNASQISAALVTARRTAGSPVMGMVMTLVIVVPEHAAERALASARQAAREHPSRMLGLVVGSARGPSRIDAEIRAGSGTAGEQALIRLTGEVAKHPESVVLPLLLPDSPVVVWWPTDAPDDPAADPVGSLGSRRITDAAEARSARTRAMRVQCASYSPGNTDLAWTRITLWRALLAAALDQVSGKVTAVSIAAERVSPSADLLGAWLGQRLRAPVTRRRADGPGITEVTLTTKAGDVRVARPDGGTATLSMPGQPDRLVGLRRREMPELLAEELRRLDPDDVYAGVVRQLNKQDRSSGRGSTRSSAPRKR